MQELAQQQVKGLSETQQQAMQKEAFVDRSISQTVQDLTKGPQTGQGGAAGIEQSIDGHGRGPALGLGPEKAAAQARGLEQGQAAAGGISKPMDGQALGQQRQAAQQQQLGREAGREQAQGVGQGFGRQQEQGQRASIHPDFERIRGQMEARLPKHVIEEVRQVGVVMANSGMQQSRMQAGVEAPAQTPEAAKPERAVGGGFGRS
jgi:hypothetical protein